MKLNHNNHGAILITGGTRGIGRAISISIAKNKSQTLILNYLQDDTSANKTRDIIDKCGSNCILIKANLNFPDEINRIFDKVRGTTTKLSAFIHCAALGAFKPTLNIKPNQWDLSMNINARSFLLCVQRTIPLMKSGNIVAISSLGSYKVVPYYGAIGPSKSALESLVRYFAVDLAPHGIRVNCVSGGLIETDSMRQFPDADDLRTSIVNKTPAGRIGQPEDIAEIVQFLISPSARWIYGQTIIADGGYSLL